MPKELTPKQVAWRAAMFRERGWKSRAVEQTAMFVDMATETKKFEESVFPPGGAQALRGRDLDPGKDFKNYMATLERFEALTPPREKGEVAALRQAAQAYLDHYDEHSDRQKNQPKTVAKRDACQQTLLDLSRYDQVAQLKELGAPPWDPATAIKAASLKAALDFESLPAGAQQAEQLDEGNANSAFWVNKSDGAGGASESFLFKPDTNKRPDIDGFPRGAETMREAMAGRTADLLTGMTGINFGVPNTQVVKIDPARFPPNALPRNMQGQPVTGSLQQFAASDGEMRKNDFAKANKIPAEESQKMAILDTITLNMDRHPGNFMMNGTDPVTLTPIDHGLTFPPPGAAVDFMAEKIGTGHNALLAIPSAHEAFSPEMLEAIEKLDPKIVVKGLKSELDTLEQAHGGATQKLQGPEGDSLAMTARSTAFLKLAAPVLPPAAVQIALGQNAKQLFDMTLDDDEFEEAAQDAIDKALEQHKDWAVFFTMPIEQQMAMRVKLGELGWPADRGLVEVSWIINNMKLAMAAYAKETPNPAAMAALYSTYGKKPVDQKLQTFTVLDVMSRRKGTELAPLVGPGALGDVSQELADLIDAFPATTVPDQEKEQYVKMWRDYGNKGGGAKLNEAIAGIGLNGMAEGEARTKLQFAMQAIDTFDAQSAMQAQPGDDDAVETKLKNDMLDYVEELAQMLPNARRASIMKAVTRYRKAMGTKNERSRDRINGVQIAALDRVRKSLTADIKELEQQLGDAIAQHESSLAGWKQDVAQGSVKTAFQQLAAKRQVLNLPRQN